MYDIFEKLLEAREVTAYRVSKATGISTATLTQWKNGISIPKQDKMQKIADFFNVSVDFLMGRENIENIDIETEIQRKVKLVTKRAEEYFTKEESEKIVELYSEIIEMLLKAKGVNTNK